MAVYLQFDSLSRSDAYFKKNIGGATTVWVPNDNYPINSPVAPYQSNYDLIQSPSNYKVYYKQLNENLDKRTIGFPDHCRDRQTNLTFSVENCTVIIPSQAWVLRTGITGGTSLVRALNEPYLFVKMAPIDYSEGHLVYSNNPGADQATFTVWNDKIQVGPTSVAETNLREQPIMDVLTATQIHWNLFRSCMFTTMRLRLDAQQWNIRIYDRFGNDVIIPESNNGGAGFSTVAPPNINPDLQTTVIVGIRPNYD